MERNVRFVLSFAVFLRESCSYLLLSVFSSFLIAPLSVLSRVVPDKQLLRRIQ